MSQQQMPSLAGVLRVVFFLAVAVLAVTVVVTGVVTLYDAPSGDTGAFQGFQGFEDDGTADYNRNVGLILGFIGAGTIVIGLLGLRSRLNPLRVGLLAGGVALVLGGVGVGSSGTDDWLIFLTSGLALAALIGSAPWLDEGLPLEMRTTGPSPGGGGAGLPGGDVSGGDPGGEGQPLG